MPTDTLPAAYSIPSYGETTAFPSWECFRDMLWDAAPDDMKGDAAGAEDYARCCLLSRNGVFVVTHMTDGSIVVENVG